MYPGGLEDMFFTPSDLFFLALNNYLFIFTKQPLILILISGVK